VRIEKKKSLTFLRNLEKARNAAQVIQLFLEKLYKAPSIPFN
jgi:hypothetical protein